MVRKQYEIEITCVRVFFTDINIFIRPKEGEMLMERRKLEELNLLDDFLFGTTMNYLGIGEEFGRTLLRIIFGREYGKLTVVAQKVYYGSDTDRHGARLDVYLEEENADVLMKRAAVYDVEPEQSGDADVRAALSRRVRFYHAKIDAGSLKSGESYHSLKNVIVIMITPYDPFGLDRMVYTIRNLCEEEPGMPYDDGARTLFLYTRGKNGNPPEELRELLQYMEHTTPENARNDDLKKIQQMVERVKKDSEVSLEYMKIFEREEMLIRQGRLEEQENTERERRRAEVAEKRADTEKERADKAEEELRKLKEQLGIHKADS